MTMELFAFKSSDRCFGIEARYVHRVVDEVEVAPVPLVPSYHMGLIYYRGELYDVIHMGRLFGDPEPVDRGSGTLFILLKWSGRKMALVPDLIVGLILPGEGEEEHMTCGDEKSRVELITPERLWQKVMKRSDGHIEV